MNYREDVSLEARKAEIAIKVERVRSLLERTGKCAAVLLRTTNFSWITAGGKSMVTLYKEAGVATIVITADAQYAITNVIEESRMRDEEMLEELGFPILSQSWLEDRTVSIAEKAAGCSTAQMISDLPFGRAELRPEWIAPLRYSLTQQEIGRYLTLGQTLSRNLEEYLVTLRPGMTEYEITGGLCEALWRENIEQMLYLTAADERAVRYRHAVPSDRKLEKHLVVSVNGKYKGLITTVTRMLHFGRSEEMEQYCRAAAEVDFRSIAALEIGTDDLAAFRACRQAYEDLGYGDMWAVHSQGGAQGYDNRDYTITEQAHGVTQRNQCYCFNPVIHGAKIEDAVIVTEDGLLPVTSPVIFPAVERQIGNTWIRRPGIFFL